MTRQTRCEWAGCPNPATDIIITWGTPYACCEEHADLLPVDPPEFVACDE